MPSITKDYRNISAAYRPSAAFTSSDCHGYRSGDHHLSGVYGTTRDISRITLLYSGATWHTAPKRMHNPDLDNEIGARRLPDQKRL